MKIALTGAMGAGKSLVAGLFRDQGAMVVDADALGRCLLEPAGKGWFGLQAEFGDRFFKADQTVDRKKLREAIFNDPTLREKVDLIMHPLIRQLVNDICARDFFPNHDRKDDAERPAITIVEVPLLYEAGWQDDFDLVGVVKAAAKTCLERVVSRDGVDLAAAITAFDSQMSPAEKISRADFVIDNNGSIEVTARQVKELYLKLAGQGSLPGAL